jgi:hypothetical protein
MQAFELINTKPVKGWEKHSDPLLDLLIENKKKSKSNINLQPSKDYRIDNTKRVKKPS